jgi:hypothetical protein
VTARKLDQLMAGSTALHGLSVQVERIAALQRAYETLAPSGLPRYSRVANLTAGELLLITESGAVAAKLRQLAPRLTGRFRRAGVEITGIRVEVQADVQEIRSKPLKNSILTPTGRKELAALAAGLDASPLKSAVAALLSKPRKNRSAA